jgi:MarR family transcriptional regulator for hemolysin
MNPSQHRLRDGFASLIARVGRQWRREVDRRLQPFGLTEATWLPLVHLARAPAPMRQKDLAASLVLDGSTVVRLLDALETSGLIERREESADRRAKTITVTARGMSIIDQVEVASREVRNAALHALSDADIESATRALELVQKNLETTQERAGNDPVARAARHRDLMSVLRPAR